MSDNFGQSVRAGTGANHVMLGSGDAIYYTNNQGNPAKPPHNQMVAAGSLNAGIVDEIENPKPQAGTNNWYTEDGYGGGSYGSAPFGGGPYFNFSPKTPPRPSPPTRYPAAPAPPPHPPLAT